MTPDVLKYDHNSHVPYAIWPQQKTHKHKASEACARSFSLCVDGLEERGRPRRSSRTASAPRATPLPRERKRRGRLATTPTTAAAAARSSARASARASRYTARGRRVRAASLVRITIFCVNFDVNPLVFLTHTRGRFRLLFVPAGTLN